MKIISKFKDFYDFNVAKYGVDPILIFDRRAREDLPAPKSLPAPPPEEHGMGVTLSWLYVGNAKVALFNSGERVYSALDIASVDAWGDVCFQDGCEYAVCYHDYLHGNSDDYFADDAAQERLREPLRPYRDIPLLLVYYAENTATRGRGGFSNLKTAYAANPQLSTLGVYLDPDFVWQKIVEYLSLLKSEAEARPEPIADDLKIVSKGFDNKRSFRPKMKK